MDETRRVDETLGVDETQKVDETQRVDETQKVDETQTVNETISVDSINNGSEMEATENPTGTPEAQVPVSTIMLKKPRNQNAKKKSELMGIEKPEEPLTTVIIKRLMANWCQNQKKSSMMKMDQRYL